MKVMVVGLFLIGQLGFGLKKLERLNPHGPKNGPISSSCTVCHVTIKGKISLKPQSTQSCVQCHINSPHSGASEHMGKAYQGSSITCLTCHSAHTDDSTVRSERSGFFGKPLIKDVDMEFRSTPNAMLRKSCTECHR